MKKAVIATSLFASLYALFAVSVKLAFGVDLTGLFAWGVTGGILLSTVFNVLMVWLFASDDEEVAAPREPETVPQMLRAAGAEVDD